MRILITGGSGYLGSRLAVYLTNLGHHIILATRKIKSNPQWLPSAEVINIDWNDREALYNICKGVDQVIHAAGINSQDCSFEQFC